MRFRYNPSCSCARCRARGFMGPAVLITVGVLFLLDQIVRQSWIHFGRTWPALLIVIGLVLFLEHNASAAGHVSPGYLPAPPPGYPQQPHVYGQTVTPPAPPAGAYAQVPPSREPTKDPEVHNG